MTGIREPIAVAAGEEIASPIEFCDPSAAVAAIGVDRTEEPRAAAPISTERPDDRHALFDRLPFSPMATNAVGQNGLACLSVYRDIPGRLAVARPSPRELVRTGKIAETVPSAHVNGFAALASGFAASCPTSHCQAAPKIVEIIWECPTPEIAA